MTAAEIYEDLKKDILHLDLKPGTMISEIELCEKYGISRTPIRDVIKKLVSEGLLEVKPHIGSFVSLIDLNKVSDTIFIRLSLELAITKELYQTFTPQSALPLQQILSNQAVIISQNNTSSSTVWEFTQADNAFHSKLYELAGKPGVWQAICSLNQHYQRFRTLLVQCNSDPMEVLYKQHCQILDDLLNRDWDALEAHMTAHITSGFQRSGEIMLTNANYFASELIS